MSNARAESQASSAINAPGGNGYSGNTTPWWVLLIAVGGVVLVAFLFLRKGGK